MWFTWPWWKEVSCFLVMLFEDVANNLGFLSQFPYVATENYYLSLYLPWFFPSTKILGQNNLLILFPEAPKIHRCTLHHSFLSGKQHKEIILIFFLICLADWERQCQVVGYHSWGASLCVNRNSSLTHSGQLICWRKQLTWLLTVGYLVMSCLTSCY